MDELLQDIIAEKERINDTLKALRKTLHRKKRTFIELAAIATCLHNIYSGMENLLKRVLKYLKIPLPDSSSSHTDLLSQAVKRGIIPQNLLVELDEYRAFRHFFVHGYGIFLNETSLHPLVPHGISFNNLLFKFKDLKRNTTTSCHSGWNVVECRNLFLYEIPACAGMTDLVY